MSEWFYVWLAYGLTWISLSVFALVLLADRRKAAAALQSMEESR